MNILVNITGKHLNGRIAGVLLFINNSKFLPESSQLKKNETL